MKLCSFIHNGFASYGVMSPSGVHPVQNAILKSYPTLLDYLKSKPIVELTKLCGEPLPSSEITWLPPISKPEKIICAGMNYRKVYPVKGIAPPDPDNIIIFSRHTETLVGHYAALERPRGNAAKTFDFEGEIVAVIGRSGRSIAKKDALNHVLGYSIMNEGSVRGWMKHSIHAGKNFHASGSWGPWIVTSDDVGEIANMQLETRVNDKLMQSAKGSEMIFSLPNLISYISEIMPLSTGDIIATGSPDGTGGSRNPPSFLKEGDTVRVSVSGIGDLENTVQHVM